ncbi:MAG: sigma 54-interacting transcriptional regulator [Oscillospiraceae bacterium]|nr:sigma 54-interacting transcriptional regulator [Oscillospiraceae bacterium]
MKQIPNYIPTIGPALNAETLLWILDHMYGNIFITNGEGKILFVNENTATVLGVSREKLLTMNATENLAGGLMSRSTTLEAIQQKKTIIGGFCTRGGVEYISTSTPLLDDAGNVQLVLTYSQEKSSIHALTDAVEQERKTAENYKYALQYTASAKAGQKTPIVESAKMKELFSFAKHIAKTDSAVLISGESGSGKEVLASYIKENSSRKDEPYIQVNCAAIPPNLMESEFFGYVAGAFTGANQKGKPGVFEMANHGTLFLDEVGELPLDLQGKLLRVLETSEFYRIGSTKVTRTDVRLIAATNKDLLRQIQEGKFREDLYYRINVIPCYIPPLRERREDILPLAEFFLEACTKRYGLTHRFAPDLLQVLMDYPWPGNVRELRNAVERITLSSTESVITMDSLRQNPFFAEFLGWNAKDARLPRQTDTDGSRRVDGSAVGQSYQELERQRVLDALLATNGNKSKAAKLLGVSAGKLYRLMDRYGI